MSRRKCNAARQRIHRSGYVTVTVGVTLRSKKKQKRTPAPPPRAVRELFPSTSFRPTRTWRSPAGAGRWWVTATAPSKQVKPLLMSRASDLLSIQEVRTKVDMRCGLAEIPPFHAGQVDACGAMPRRLRAHERVSPKWRSRNRLRQRPETSSQKNLLAADLLPRTIRGMKTIGRHPRDPRIRKVVEKSHPYGSRATIIPDHPIRRRPHLQSHQRAEERQWPIVISASPSLSAALARSPCEPKPPSAHGVRGGFSASPSQREATKRMMEAQTHWRDPPQPVPRDRPRRVFQCKSAFGVGPATYLY